MKTLTVEVVVDGVAHYPRIHLDDQGMYRGRSLSPDVPSDDQTFHTLSWWCKGFGDAVNGRGAEDGEWYSKRFETGLKWIDDVRWENPHAPPHARAERSLVQLGTSRSGHLQTVPL